MPHYGKRSMTNLKQSHVDLQRIFQEVIKYFDCSIICGHRSKAAQNKAFKERKSKLQYPKSKHNKKPSMAVDAVPYPIDWKDTKRMLYFAGFVVGISHRLYDQGKISHLVRWGGDWDKDTQVNDQRFNDYPHFELYKPKKR